MQWRERSLEPLSAPIDLTRAGSYSFRALGFHASSHYHPEFRLQLPFKTDVHNWFVDDGYVQLWGESPPAVRIEIMNRAGKQVFFDESKLTRSGGWAVTGAIGMSEVELYSSKNFVAEMFESYSVNVSVEGASPRAAAYGSTFEVSTVKAYVLLGPVLLFLVLCVVVVGAAIVIATVHIVIARRRRQRVHGTAA